MPRRRLVFFAIVVASAGALAAGCSSAPATPARERFVSQLQQAGAHRFDQVQVGDGATALTTDQARCVAAAFEKNKWPFDSALDGKLPTKVDVKELNRDVNACLKDPGTTTIGLYG